MGGGGIDGGLKERLIMLCPDVKTCVSIKDKNIKKRKRLKEIMKQAA